MKLKHLPHLWGTIAAGALPAGHWRSGVGMLWVVTMALLVALAAGEALGWPFLAQPLSRWLSNQLDRRIDLASADAAASTANPTFSVRFIGGVRLKSSQIEVGAPAWSTAGPTLRASDVLLELRYVDLWRAYRGQPLHIGLLRAQQLDAQLERLADGRASWQFGPHAVPADPTSRPALPTFGAVALGARTLHYRDEPLQIDLDIRLSLADAEAGAERLQMQATGTWRGQPMKAELRSAATPLTGAEAARSALPLSLKASVRPRPSAVRRPGPGCRSAGRPERSLPSERAVAGRRG
jgi:AsmA family protein